MAKLSLKDLSYSELLQVRHDFQKAIAYSRKSEVEKIAKYQKNVEIINKFIKKKEIEMDNQQKVLKTRKVG